MARGRNPGTLTGGGKAIGQKETFIKPKSGATVPPQKTEAAAKARAKKNKTPVKPGLRKGMQDPATGYFLPGNKIWQESSSFGEKPIFADANELWLACVEYFEAVYNNPLHEAQVKSYEGDHEIVAVPKMRAMSIGALCVFLDITRNAWSYWRANKPEFHPAMDKVEEIIRAQKFEGASAGLFNASIIARDIGLVEKVEQANSVEVIIKGKDAEL